MPAARAAGSPDETTRPGHRPHRHRGGPPSPHGVGRGRDHLVSAASSSSSSRFTFSRRAGLKEAVLPFPSACASFVLRVTALSLSTHPPPARRCEALLFSAVQCSAVLLPALEFFARTIARCWSVASFWLRCQTTKSIVKNVKYLVFTGSRKTMGFLHWISTKKSVEMAQPHMSRVGWRSKIGDC